MSTTITTSRLLRIRQCCIPRYVIPRPKGIKHTRRLHLQLTKRYKRPILTLCARRYRHRNNINNERRLLLPTNDLHNFPSRVRKHGLLIQLRHRSCSSPFSNRNNTPMRRPRGTKSLQCTTIRSPTINIQLQLLRLPSHPMCTQRPT